MGKREDERVAELVKAWRTSRHMVNTGQMGSLEGARERVEILRMARAEGLLERVRKGVTG